MQDVNGGRGEREGGAEQRRLNKREGGGVLWVVELGPAWWLESLLENNALPRNMRRGGTPTPGNL